jgi:HPt (histidine-containing phosphotransfer) domain-containing protein
MSLDPIIDRATYLALQDSMGADFMDELVASYLNDTPTQIAALRNALETSDAEVFRRAAHSIKSTSLNFGALPLANKARELENRGRDGQLEGADTEVDALAEAFALVRGELEALKHE